MNIAVVLAAGKSTRLNEKVKKQFLIYRGKMLFIHSIDTFLSLKDIDKVVLVIDPLDRDTIEGAVLDYGKKICLVDGGANRYDSVRASIDYADRYLKLKDTDKILIHDAARPFVEADDIDKLLESLDKYDVVSLATRTTDTIKRVKNVELIDDKKIALVDKTIDRTTLWNIMTPQGFKFGVIKEAYDRFYSNGTSISITDDLQIIENFSDNDCYLLEGSKHNIKITTKEDLKYLNI